MKSHTKILLFSALDMWQEKIQNVQKLIVQIPYTLFSSKWMDTLKKLIEKKIFNASSYQWEQRKN